MNVAIIGCGLIGRKRAAALGESRLRVCADTIPERAAALAATAPYAEAATDWRAAVARRDVDIVVVATTHDRLAEIATAAVNAGKHVLIEKPGARRAAELDSVRIAAQRNNVRVRIGFNHRFHPALLRAQQVVREGLPGPLLFVRGRYGHGGRPGYEQEWRMRPEVSGGGELLDQGTHLIDLARMFLGEFAHASGCVPHYFWNAPVEDNAFLLLRTASEQVAFLHASWTEWKNLFSLEICGRDAKLDIAGLGGCYGVERLTLYHMRPDMGPPDTTSWEWPMGDRSWALEFEAFCEDIRLGREPVPGVSDAQAVLRIVESVYEGAGR